MPIDAAPFARIAEPFGRAGLSSYNAPPDGPNGPSNRAEAMAELEMEPQCQAASINAFVNKVYQGDAAQVMGHMPSGSIDLIITSPPYWTAVKYGDGQVEGGDAPGNWATYDAYLEDMQRVWSQCARVLRPNGKLCINAPLMPIPKEIIQQHTRHLKDIAGDIGQTILLYQPS